MQHLTSIFIIYIRIKRENFHIVETCFMVALGLLITTVCYFFALFNEVKAKECFWKIA